MLIWVLKDGEHLPVQADLRKMRTGMLADALAGRGHSVVWWSSTFSHQRKMSLYKKDTEVAAGLGVRLRLLHAGTYGRNVSLARYLHHRTLARRFRVAARAAEHPHVIVTAFPPIELAREAVRFGREHGIPTVLDVRDLWPDTFLEQSPAVLRPFARLLLRGDFNRTREAMASATSLVAISEGCLTWGLRHAGRMPGPLDRIFHTGYPDALVGGPPSKVTQAIEELRKRCSGKTVFTFVGTFGKSYQLALVCDVARRLAQEEVGGVHFVLVGDGEQTPGITRAARTLPNTTLLGWLDQHQIREVLRLTGVGLVPVRSVPDAMPNKVFEFLAAGVPVLSSVTGEMARILAEADAGLSYPPGDADALEHLVRGLAVDAHGRARMGQNARELFRRRFGAAAIYGDYAAHVEEVAASAGAAA